MVTTTLPVETVAKKSSSNIRTDTDIMIFLCNRKARWVFFNDFVSLKLIGNFGNQPKHRVQALWLSAIWRKRSAVQRCDTVFRPHKPHGLPLHPGRGVLQSRSDRLQLHTIWYDYYQTHTLECKCMSSHVIILNVCIDFFFLLTDILEFCSQDVCHIF